MQTPDRERAFFSSDFQKQVWEDNYRFGNETIGETIDRVAATAASAETDPQKKAELFENIRAAFFEKRICFGGRIVANAGTSVKAVGLFNCYGAQRSVKPVDSIENIYSDLTNTANILKTEGGVGLDFSHLRPAGTFIRGIGTASPGVVKFMELFDKSSEIITGGYVGEWKQYDGQAGAKKRIRKGAQIAFVHCAHPDVEAVIDAKLRPRYLERFNISVICTDEFMRAVESDGEWELWFPDISFERYDEEWDGNFDRWRELGYPRVVYKRLPARELFEKITRATYERNEPGVYFIDSANRYNNILYAGQRITGTNPCGEIAQCADAATVKIGGETVEILGDVCNLGSLNLTAYVRLNSDGVPAFDFDAMERDAAMMVRALDNLIDVSSYPLPGIERAAKARRKVGVGLMGYGSCLFMLGMRYGSPEALAWTEEMMRRKVNAEYRASALLAREKGPFPLCDPEKLVRNGFVANSGALDEDVVDLIREHGLRNAQLSTVAPTGSTAVFMGIVSGGVEPVFEREYYRWVTWTHRASEVDLDLPDFQNGDMTPTKDFRRIEIGGEPALESKCGQYRIDASRGLIKKVLCEDYGWKWVRENLSPERFAELEQRGVFATAMELSVDEHVSAFTLISRYVDNSVSKTVNVKREYPYDDFRDIYMRVWREGARGCTTYREGTMLGVLEKKKEVDSKKSTVTRQQREFLREFEKHDGDIIFNDVKLPEEFPMRGYVIRAEGKKFYIMCAFKDKKKTKPFAVFVSTNSREKNIVASNAVEILEQLARDSGLPEEKIEDVLRKINGDNNIDKIARMTGFLLRHNVRVYDIVRALDRVEEATVGTFTFRFKKFLSQFVDVFYMEEHVKCPNCGGRVQFAESCFVCVDCGNGKCA